eukprot:TRINITY_DN29902_c0_g1_i1.p1 TRINITY_DN29902_c0_g1~~TRINITY_DN29902_c0_g1_i1.p1  ORF type:complete len:327 (+),score=30.73 TRINITY_DN29902_c0_g1_i1:755-1735(+)
MRSACCFLCFHAWQRWVVWVEKLIAEKSWQQLVARPEWHEMSLPAISLVHLMKAKLRLVAAEDVADLQNAAFRNGCHEALCLELDRLLQEKCFLCPICAAWVAKHKQLSCPAGHTWCEACFMRWVALPEQLASMIARRSLDIVCLHGSAASCREQVSCRITRNIQQCRCSSRRTCNCGPLARLCRDMDRRSQLLSRAGRHRCVDCPQPDCVGVAYSGGATLMCFVCEHQWNARRITPTHVFSRLVFLVIGSLVVKFAVLGSSLGKSAVVFSAFVSLKRYVCSTESQFPGCKRCPQCSILIEKSGGCDHMMCRCGHQFFWTTGQPRY